MITPLAGGNLFVTDCRRHILPTGATVATMLKPEPGGRMFGWITGNCGEKTTFLVFLPAATWARIIPSDCHFFPFLAERLPSLSARIAT